MVWRQLASAQDIATIRRIFQTGHMIANLSLYLIPPPLTNFGDHIRQSFKKPLDVGF
jgi:hypothetical protein